MKKSLNKNAFHLEFKTQAQKMAWSVYEQSDVQFLLGPAGVGKTFMAVAFAIKDVLERKRSRIILTRPVVEAGEYLGWLPGDIPTRVGPFIEPIYDCVAKLVGVEGLLRERINKVMQLAPIAYLRGRTFDNAVCIFDEAQNATYGQLKLYLTRLGENCKMIITGDPQQSDLKGPVALVDVINRLEQEQGIGIVHFKNSSIVRHPLVGKILERLEDK